MDIAHKPERLVVVTSTGPSDKGDWMNGGKVMAKGEKAEVTETQAASLIAAGHASAS
jgi:hypothetical protein